LPTHTTSSNGGDSSALYVFFRKRDALYKSTFYLLTYLLTAAPGAAVAEAAEITYGRLRVTTATRGCSCLYEYCRSTGTRI